MHARSTQMQTKRECIRGDQVSKLNQLRVDEVRLKESLGGIGGVDGIDAVGAVPLVDT